MQTLQRLTGKTLLSYTASDWRCLQKFLTKRPSITVRYVALQTGIRLWFIRDGAPLHFVLAVREFLYKTFPEHWDDLGQQHGLLLPYTHNSGDTQILLSVLQNLKMAMTANNKYRMNMIRFITCLEFSIEGSHTSEIHFLLRNSRWTFRAYY